MLIWNGPRGKRMNYDFSLSVGTHGGRPLKAFPQTDTQTDKQADRLTNRQTDWQTGTQTDKQANRLTNRHTDTQTDKQADRLTNRQTGRLTDRQTLKVVKEIMGQGFWRHGKGGGGKDCILSIFLVYDYDLRLACWTWPESKLFLL